MTSLAGIRSKHFPGSQLAPKRSKYGNRKTILDGMTFDSKAEAGHWAELQIRERAGEIRNLKRQVPFECVWNGLPICKYLADFTFDERRDGRWYPIVADTKGIETALFRLKAKIMRAAHGIEVRLMRTKR